MPREVFRLVRGNPPTLDDFKSQRAEKPNAVFQVSECQARGLSVFAERRDSERALKLPTLRGRLICRLRLDAGAGRIQQTGRPTHHTWWPLADFDILAQCGLVDEDRFFFEQIREKATANEQVVKLRRANPFDKFQLGLRQLIEDLMVQRQADNDKIVTRYMDDEEFGSAAFAVLSKAIYDSIPPGEVEGGT